MSKKDAALAISLANRLARAEMRVLELEAENERLRSFVREDGDNLIKAGVLLDKDKIIAELEQLTDSQASKILELERDCDGRYKIARSELEAEIERLRGNEEVRVSGVPYKVKRSDLNGSSR